MAIKSGLVGIPDLQHIFPVARNRSQGVNYKFKHGSRLPRTAKFNPRCLFLRTWLIFLLLHET